MSYLYQDYEISAMIGERKYVSLESFNRLRWRQSDGKRRKEVDLQDINGNAKYAMFCRQSLYDFLDFTVGLAYKVPASNEKVNLIRCNGNSHPHFNRIEKVSLNYTFHVHTATERYQKLGLKIETYAEETDQYTNIDGAEKYLIRLANIAVGNSKQSDLNVQFEPK